MRDSRAKFVYFFSNNAGSAHGLSWMLALGLMTYVWGLVVERRVGRRSGGACSRRVSMASGMFWGPLVLRLEIVVCEWDDCG
jgi:hypothetical protein